MEVLTVCKLKTFSRVCYLFPDAHNIICVTNRRADYYTDLSGFRLIHRAIIVSTNYQTFLSPLKRDAYACDMRVL